MKSTSILILKTQQFHGELINPKYPYHTQLIEKKIGSASFFKKKAVQYIETFPFISTISKDWSKLLLLSCLNKPIKCVVLIGWDGTCTHLYIIGTKSFSREERTALLFTASNDFHIQLTGGSLAFDHVETLINDWRHDLQLQTVAGMIINDLGIIRCGEWPQNSFFFEKWF